MTMSSGQSAPGPLAPLAGALSNAQKAWDHIGSSWQGLSQDLDHRRREVQTAASHLLADLGQRAGHPVRRFQDFQHRHQAMAGLASMSLAAAGGPRHSRAQLVAELAYNPEEIKARLAGIPVYTVANKQNEFVLVAGESGGEVRQLGLIFLSEADAHALVDKVREQNPKLAKQSRVLKVTMDAVYDFAIDSAAAETRKEGVVFRFMPDAKEVQSALQLYTEAGLPASAFTGVPVFQAQGLTVKAETQRYTPLFLAKADLDAAVGAAYGQREASREAAAAVKAQAAEEEVAAAQSALEAAPRGKERKVAQAELDRASAKLSKYRGRLGGGDGGNNGADAAPRVEVGCLEEVIGKMEADTSGEWGSVMFIPKGALAVQQP